jgi:peptide chain release factor subunit 1
MQQLDFLSTQKASGTSLVSYYIKGGINQTGQKLTKEISQAENIKSKDTRKAVTSALKAIQQTLKNYTNIPENGLAVFASDEYCV